MIPSSIVAGDTIKLKVSYPTYDGWNATLYLSGASKVTVTGTPMGYGEFEFTIPASQTSFLKAGVYAFSIRLDKSGEKTTVESGNITVLPNPETQASKEALANRMIELIEKALLNQLSTGEAVESISIAGRSISMMNRQDLLNERAYWSRELKALVNARTGNAGIRQIRVVI